MPTVTLKLELLKPTQPKQEMYRQMTETNTILANNILSYSGPKLTTKTAKLLIKEKLPSAIINQTIRTTNSQQKKQKAQTFKNTWCEFNNQNFKIERSGELYTVSFPTLEKRIGVPVVTKKYQQQYLEQILSNEAQIGSARLIERDGKWFIHLSISLEIQPVSSEKVIGVDLGLRYIAVAAAGTKTIFFPGNRVSYIRRRHSNLRKELGKAKKLRAIKKSKNKESRTIRDTNHKISRAIVNFAKDNGVGTIRMENLTNIRHRAKSRKERGRSLHSWAHYQLKEMICYKAELAGIAFELVNPKHTSQTCKCSHREKANRNGLIFKCKKCGYTAHADVNGAINIDKAISGLAQDKSA